MNNSSSGFSSNSKASALELLENLEEIFIQDHMDSCAVRRFKYSTTHWCVTRCWRVKYIFVIEHNYNFVYDMNIQDTSGRS